MKGAIARAHEIVAAIPGAVMPQQFENPANPDIHRRTTAEEIWNDTEGKVDFVISGVGTGGTITGVGQVLKAKKPSVKMIALEPEDSPVLSGGQPGPHKFKASARASCPPSLDRKVIDEVITISNETALETARLAARLEGFQSASRRARQLPRRWKWVRGRRMKARPSWRSFLVCGTLSVDGAVRRIVKPPRVQSAPRGKVRRCMPNRGTIDTALRQYEHAGPPDKISTD